MNDLDQIRRQNARATLDTLNTQRRAGYHCVVEFQGLNAVDIHAFKSFPEAKNKCGDIFAQPGATATYYPPIFIDVVDHLDRVNDSLANQARAALATAGRPFPATADTRPSETN